MNLPDFLFQYTITYAGFCLFCVFIMLTMIIRMDRDMGSEEEVRKFRYAGISGSLCMAAQAVWMLGNSRVIPYPRILNSIVNCCDLIFTGTTVYYWFRLIECKSSRKFFSSNAAVRVLSYVPIVFLSIVNVLSIGTGWIFTINDANEYVRGPFYSIQIFCSYIYYFLSLVLSVAGMRRGSVAERILSRQLLLFSLFPVFGGIMQILFGVFPFTVATVLLSIFYLFINMQNQRINTDALTGLNNRFRTKQFLENRIREADTKPFYLFMIDVNRFKEINDSYGHLSGDQALMVLADALRMLGSRHKGFTGRYGGDEFTAIVDTEQIRDPFVFSQELNKTIEETMENRQLEFNVTVAVGYTGCCNHIESFSDVVERADQMLYQEKERLKKEGFR